MRTLSTLIRHSLLLATALCVANTALNAQVAAYTFSQLAGTYTPITGGTVLGTTASDDESFVDPATPAGGTTITGVGLPIGFNFTFNGSVFDRFAVNTNGWISLGQSALSPAVNINSSSNYTPLSSTITITPTQLYNRIAGLGRDLQGQTGSEMRYQTIGTAPNRVLVMQWSNYSRWNVTTGNNFNFQIRLYETTNIVEVVYGTFTTTETATNTAQVGLRGAVATDFNNRLVASGTNTWATSTSGTANSSTAAFSSTLVPASGQTYRWTPSTCLPPVGLSTTSTTATSANFSWTTNLTNGQIVVVPQGSPATSAAPVAATGTTFSWPSLTPNTNYTVFLRNICGAGDTSNWTLGVNFATPCLPTNVPWSESFEGVTVSTTGGPLPSCWTRNVTDLATGNNAQTNNRSARTGTKYLYGTWGTAAGTGDWAFTPGFNLTAGQSYDFSFWYRTDGYSGWDTIRVGVGNGQNANAMAIIGRMNSVTTTNYTEYRVSYTPTTSGVYYFGLNVWANGVPWYITFDDFNLEFTPTCPSPTALNASAVTNASATLGWTGNGQPNNYYYYFAPSPAAIPAGTVGTYTNTTSFNATGLTGNTSYSFFVRQFCTPGDTSAWAGPFTFTTSCDPQTLGDTYANPFIVGSLPYTTSGNTNSPCYTNTIGNSSKDVWYRVILDKCAETMTATLCTGTSYDSYLRIYAADGVTQLALNDDSCSTQSIISNLTIAGRDTVYVLVEGYSSSVGAYTLTISQSVPNPVTADVAYDTLYCSNAANPLPVNNATVGGMFSALTAGIALDTATGEINIAASTAGVYDVIYTVTGNTPTCIDRDTNTVEISILEDATFAYAVPAFCNTATNPAPTITGTQGGNFTASSTDLVFDAATGQIDLAASLTGTYDVTYTTTGTCFASATNTVTLDAPQDASFDYGTGVYCQNVADPAAMNVVTAGGSFTAPANLVINPNTGLVDLSLSQVGTYMVTYTTPNACAIAQSASFTINAADDASFSFGATVFCQNLPSPQAVVTGLPFGTFSSGTGLPVDITFGLVDLGSAQTNVNHTVIYATNGACPNFSVQTIRVIPADTAEFAYQGVTYCLTALSTQETPTITGNTGGTFSSTAGIDLNANTGTIDLGFANSQAGTYTVTYITNGPTTCPDTATATIILDNCSGVQELGASAQGEAYKLYPNPTEGNFFVHNNGDFKIANIELLDVLGRVVYSQYNAALPAQTAIRIETSQLPAATYYLRISAENAAPVVLPVAIMQP